MRKTRFSLLTVFAGISCWAIVVAINVHANVSVARDIHDLSHIGITSESIQMAQVTTRRGWPLCFQEVSHLAEVNQLGELEQVTVDTPKGFDSISLMPLLADIGIALFITTVIIVNCQWFYGVGVSGETI